MTSLAIVLGCVVSVAAQEAESPWGIAPSHSASWGVGSWSKEIAETGVRWMRGFHQGDTDRVLGIAEKNGYQVAGILQWSKKGGPGTFPADAIPEWKAYVTGMI